MSFTSCHAFLRAVSSRIISVGETTRSHFRPFETHFEQRSDSEPTLQPFRSDLQLVYARIAMTTKEVESSFRRTLGLRDFVIRRGVIKKDSWIFGTKILGGDLVLRLPRSIRTTPI